MAGPNLIEEPQNDQEALMAYWLENASPGDIHLLSSLVDAYGEELYRLSSLLLANRRWDEDVSGKAMDLTGAALGQAIAKLDSFRVAPSVRSWLFGEIVKLSRSFLLRLKWMIKPPESCMGLIVDDSANTADSQLIMSEQWQALYDLPTLERMVYCLCKGFELTIEETAYVLLHDETEINGLFARSNSKLQQRFSGVFDERANSDHEFRQFITTNWKAPKISDILISQVGSRDTEQVSTLDMLTRVSEKLMEGVAILVALLVGIIAIWYFTRGDYSSGKPLFPAQAKPTPTAIVITDLEARNAPEAVETEIQYSYHLEPDLSDNERWLVFIHFDHLQSADIYLADLYTGGLNQLDAANEGSNVVESNGESGSYNPKISADGRFVVFASNKVHLYPGEPPLCQWRSAEVGCFNLYIYDRETEILELITQAENELPANGHSLMPVISPDGNWVAFWSAANNLLNDQEYTCEFDTQHCWDVYLYNRESSEIRRLPVGRGRDSIDIVRIFPLSISLDGSRIALTVIPDDRIAEKMSLKNTSEVFVYDWDKLLLQTVAVDESGQPGAGDSFLPVLSADGRYVAFVSEADKLVAEDSNGTADVYVRDLEMDVTELVSISNQGEPGNDHSGILPDDTIMWGEQIDISAGGRYVTFLSRASNLSDIEGEGCRASQFSYCSEVYIHDRITKSITTVISQPRGDGFFLFPGLSGDGSTVWYVHYHHNCPQAPYCADILFFDPQSALTVAPLSEGYHIVQDYPGDWQSTWFLDAGSGGGVHSLAFSPDGTILAAGLSDGHIRLWNIPDGSFRNTLEIHKRPVDSVIYDPAGNLLVSGSHDGTLSYWSAIDDALLRHLPGNAGAVFDLEFSPNGDVLTIAAQRGTMNWDVRDLFFGMLNYLEYPNEQVRSAAVSPDGKLVAHGLSDGSLWLRDAKDMTVVIRLAAHEDLITSLEFSPDGKLLASGSRDGKAKIWNLQEEGKTWGIELALVTQHNDWVNDIAFSPDGRWLGVVAFKSDIYLWGVPGAVSQDYALNADGYQPLSIAFSQDGRWMAAGSSWSGVRIWELPQQ